MSCCRSAPPGTPRGILIRLCRWILAAGAIAGWHHLGGLSLLLPSASAAEPVMAPTQVELTVTPRVAGRR